MTITAPLQTRRWRMLALLGTAFFMTILDGTSLLTALPAIEHGLHLHGPAIQWTVTAYALAFGGLLLLCGRAADLLGRRRVFVAGMLLRVVASLACGLAPSIQVLVAAQGVSALRTKVTKGAGSRAAALAMVFKLVESAEVRWRAVNAPPLVTLVRAGARFERGHLVERSEAHAA